MNGRPPLPDSERRNVTLRARVKAESAARFKAAAAGHGITESDALRTAVVNWIKLAENTEPSNQETRP